MISKRNFFSISIMMFILFFLVQFFMVMRDTQNEYDVNENFEARQNDGKSEWEQTDVDLETLIEKEASYVLFIGDGTGEIGTQVSRWCTYTKRNFICYGTLAEFSEDVDWLPEAVVLESERYADGENLTHLETLLKQGVTGIFCSLEDSDAIAQDDELMTVLGIRDVWSNAELTGVKLFDGFLLGGEMTYQVKEEKDEKRQDMPQNVPWYQVRSGTKVYMVGLMDEGEEEEEIENEKLPSLIWRNGTMGGMVFAVCGDYMKDSTAIGILDAMMAESNEYVIYPVINAQNLSILNFPLFADENEEKMQALYSRSISATEKDIIWPALVSLVAQTNMKMTCFIQPQEDYLDEVEPKTDDFVYFLKQMKEQGAEAALSLAYVAADSLEDKLARDRAFLASTGSIYTYGSAFVGENSISLVAENLYSSLLKDVGTLLCESEEGMPLVSYYGDFLVLQQVTSDSASYTYSDDFRMRSIQTALGYTNVKLDMQDIFFPEEGAAGWETVQEEFSSNLLTYWKNFEGFDGATLSESNMRVRTFLNLDYTYYKEGNQITLETSHTGAWFLFRNHGEAIDSIEGGTLKELEDNVYLIQAQENTVVLKGKKSSLHYYTSE